MRVHAACLLTYSVNLCIILYWNGKVDSFSGSTLPKLPIISQNASNKSYWALNSIQKCQWAHISISSGLEQWGSKNRYFSNIILYWNEKVDSLSGSMLPKLLIISENASIKSCWELNYVQKSQWGHMSISAGSGTMGLQRLICFKYEIVLKWESRFTFGLNFAKDAAYIKKTPIHTYL